MKNNIDNKNEWSDNLITMQVYIYIILYVLLVKWKSIIRLITGSIS